MALAQFKRINPFTPEQQTEMYRLMLEYLVSHPDEWDELLEPEEPLPPETEFVDHQCPECRGYRLGFGPAVDIRSVTHPDWAPSGHRATCSRWLRCWPEDRKDTLS